MTNSSKDRRLGKGLAALLGTPLDDHGHPLPEQSGNPSASASDRSALSPSESQSDVPNASAPAARQLLELNVAEIDNNPFQPRRQFNPEEIASLAASLKEHEQLQPILVRQVGGRYQLISGERRLRAAIHAGMSTVRAEVRVADDRLVAELAIVENLQRKDLNAIEKAMSFRRYIEQHGCTQDELGQRLKIDRSTIANFMRLLELPEKILTSIQEGGLSAGHGRALLPIGDETEQVKLAETIITEGWSVRAVETYVNEKLKAEEAREMGVYHPPSGSTARRSVTPQIEALQQELKHQLGTKVEIRQASRGRGKITIHFHSPEEFERLRALLSTQSPLQLRSVA